jgi:hypothetical protein
MFLDTKDVNLWGHAPQILMHFLGSPTMLSLQTFYDIKCSFIGHQLQLKILYLNSLPIFQFYLVFQNPIDHKMIKHTTCFH